MQAPVSTIRRTSNVSTKSTLAAAFVGLSLASNYALSGVPNVKLMDMFNFTAAYLFGLSFGLSVAILTRTTYAIVNPWGPASGWLLVMLVAADCLYAIGGWLARRVRLIEKRGGFVERSVVLGLVGFFSALGFDLITNFGGGLVAVSGPSLSTYFWSAFVWGLITMNFPLPMGLLHEISDFVFFSTVAPVAISKLKRSSMLDISLFAGPKITERRDAT